MFPILSLIKSNKRVSLQLVLGKFYEHLKQVLHLGSKTSAGTVFKMKKPQHAQFFQRSVEQTFSVRAGNI